MLGHPPNCSCQACVTRELRRMAKKGLTRRYKKDGRMLNTLTERGRKWHENPDNRWRW